MAIVKQSLFIEDLTGNPINMSLIQTIYIDPNDSTNVVWVMRNGEKKIEDLASEEDALNRYNYIKGLLLGTTVAELESTITDRDNTISEQNIIINNNNNDIDNVTKKSININGEEVI